MAAVMHDQGALAWFIVVSYLLGAMLSFRAGITVAGRERILWFGTALAFVLLGLNKQLDLQSDLTWAAKIAAHKEGWYDNWRRDVQGVFILLIAAGSVGFALFLWRWLRQTSNSARIAGVGLVILLAFIVVRAASFHQFDHWVTVPVAGMRSGWWLELLGIAVISAAAVNSRLRSADSRTSTS